MTDPMRGAHTVHVWHDDADGWPERPTDSRDIAVWWCSTDGTPDPPIILAGTKGMLNGVDVRSIHPVRPRSADEDHPMFRVLEGLINQYKQKPGYYS